jgi:hypothetical protein
VKFGYQMSTCCMNETTNAKYWSMWAVEAKCQWHWHNGQLSARNLTTLSVEVVRRLVSCERA